MSAPILWIGVPGVLALLLAVLRRYERLNAGVGMAAGLFLALLAWVLPLNQPTGVGPLQLTISDTFFILGRRFVLTASDRTWLVLLYATFAFWCGGVLSARPGRTFVSFGLAIVAVLTAALAVRPFLYAALLIQIAVLLSVPILSPPGTPVNRGVLRFLTFQTLAMPFILLTGWLLEGQSAAAPSQSLIIGISVMLALGFIFLLGVFPFHTWVPMLAETAHPYAASFIFYFLPFAGIFFGLSFLENFSSLQSYSVLFTFLRTAGTAMVVTAGLWSAFQNHLGRILGYAVLVDIGVSLLLLASLEEFPDLVTQSSTLLVRLFAGRCLALVIASLSLYVFLSNRESLHLSNLQGAARRYPLAGIGYFLSVLSLAGFPLLPEFHSRLSVLSGLASASPLLPLLVLVGCLGLVAAGLRSSAVLVMGAESTSFQSNEPARIRVLLGAGIILILTAGLVL